MKGNSASPLSYHVPEKANLEYGFGTLPTTNLLIIDATDTVYVKKSKGRITRKPFYRIGGDYVLTLRD